MIRLHFKGTSMDFLHKRAEFLKVKDHFVLKGIGPLFF